MRSFTVIDERNDASSTTILEAAAKGRATGRTRAARRLLRTCMDEAAIEKNAHDGARRSCSSTIDGVKDSTSLREGGRARSTCGVGSPLFELRAAAGLQGRDAVIAALDQGGLGLPDRDYYLQTTSKSQSCATSTRRTSSKMLTLAGDAGARRPRHAATVLRSRRRSRKASMTRVDRREPKKIYHRIDWRASRSWRRSVHWNDLPEGAWACPTSTRINVTRAGLLRRRSTGSSTTTPIADWKTYLRWHVHRHDAAPSCRKAFVDENFAFYGKTLTGTEKHPAALEALRARRPTARSARRSARRSSSKTFGADGKDAAADDGHARSKRR